VLRALNAGMRPSVILACREIEYKDISESPIKPSAIPAVLSDARHVTVRPLEAAEIVQYLKVRFRGVGGQLNERWQPIAEALIAQEPIVKLLANPWQLFLAVTAYTPEKTKPADLLTMTIEEAEVHLLDGLIPAIIERDEAASRRRWISQRVTRWLSAIADHQWRNATE
jgi:hypothetical protein